ncbi:MAG TPA: DUF1732 domain-containing protein, partial [Longimicrobiales bacterium]|nr:DUF1732 domain-containing protein [Longimicrobiales bacterium]
PPGFDRFERDLTEVLRSRIIRGHVTLYLGLDRRSAENGAAVRLDLDRARGYKAALEEMQRELGLEGTVELAVLARFGDLFRAPEPEALPEVEVEVLREMAAEATAGLVALREAEGARLLHDMEGRLGALTTHLDVVAARAPERLVRERDRLREAVRELSQQVEVDEDRLAREIAYAADRWDVNEELVRFRAHIAAFRDALATDGAESVGKRLGFLVQEMHREANTMGSKANDGAIAEASIALKEEIERLREQVENVE